MMILKFTTMDMLNASLIDVATGERVYDINTRLQTITPEAIPDVYESETPSSSSSGSSSTPPPSKPLPRESSSSPDWRRTLITSPSTGQTLAEIGWSGRRPLEIVIKDENITLPDLFGSSTIRFVPKILALPTRFDTEYTWTATPDSLTIYDYDSDQIKGQFHQHAFLMSTNPERPTRFINSRIPGLGNLYLEFEQHPLASDVEIIVSFLMMEVLRRGRFALTPYMFPAHTPRSKLNLREVVKGLRFRRATI